MGQQDLVAACGNPLGTRATRSWKRAFESHAAALLLGLLLVGGCSDANVSSNPGETAVGTVSRDSLASDLAEWICDGAATCCDSAGVDFDRGRCLENMRDRELRRWSSELDRNRDFSESMAAKCSTAIQESAPTCGNPRGVLVECFKMLDGSLSLGEECESKFECNGQRDGLVSCIDGRCAQRREAGEPCDNCSQCLVRCESLPDGTSQCAAPSNATLVEVGLGDRCFSVPSEDGSQPPERFVCAPGLACDPIDMVCITTRIPPGEACNARWGSIFCADDARCVDGICSKDIAVGEPCEGRGCAQGLYCDRVNGRCAPYAEEGETCGHTTSLDRDCAPNLVCGRPRGSGTGECTTPERYWCSRAS